MRLTDAQLVEEFRQRSMASGKPGSLAVYRQWMRSNAPRLLDIMRDGLRYRGAEEAPFGASAEHEGHVA